MLPRNQTQANILRTRWNEAIESTRIIIPKSAVDGLNLIWNSDLVISGGGTMNREAAALGVPVYSIFRGRLGAVDQYLAATGRLAVIEKIDDIPQKIALKRRIPVSLESKSQGIVLNGILAAIISIAERKCLPQC
jgi:predicted glycosyltransferase